jgi:hypothetical protein
MRAFVRASPALGRRPCCTRAQAVRKMMDAKKLESTLNYDSDFKKNE